MVTQYLICVFRTCIADFQARCRTEYWQGEGLWLRTVRHDVSRQAQFSAIPFRLLQGALLNAVKHQSSPVPGV